MIHYGDSLSTSADDRRFAADSFNCIIAFKIANSCAMI